MEMRTVSRSEFYRRGSALLERVQKTREPLRVTRFGRPFVEVHPPGPTDEERAQRDARDLEILNRYADELNRDALDGLEFQAEVDLDALKRRGGKEKTGQKR